MLKFIVNGQTLERADEEPPIRGTVGLKAAFLFKGTVWTEAESVVARYDVGGNTTYEVLLDVPGNGYVETFVPWEALKKSRFTVACIAGSETPTNGVAVVTAASGFRGEESPAAPSETVYQQLLAKFNEAVEAIGTISGSKDEAAASAAAAAASAESAAASAESAASTAQEAAASATAASTSASEAAKSASDAADVLEQAKEVGAAADEALKTAQSAVTEAENAVKSAEAATAEAKAASAEVKDSADKITASTEAAAKSASDAAASETSAKEYARQAKESADASAASASDASTSKTAAAASASTAATRAADAAAEVTKAAGEVTKAKAEVANAQAEVKKASDHASEAAASAEEAAGYARAASASKDASAASAAEAAASASGVGDKLTEAETAANNASAKADEAAASAAAAKKSAEDASAAAGGGVTSFNGRGGVVSPQAGDYTAEMVGAVASSQKGANGGVASLDESGKVPSSQLPAMDYDAAGSAEAVKAWVQGQNYLTEHQSLTGYATESWVEGKGYQTAEEVSTAVEGKENKPFKVYLGDLDESNNRHSPVSSQFDGTAVTLADARAALAAGKDILLTFDSVAYEHWNDNGRNLFSGVSVDRTGTHQAFWDSNGIWLNDDYFRDLIPDWVLEGDKPTYTASEVGADASGSAAQALADAKTWVGEQGFQTASDVQTAIETAENTFVVTVTKTGSSSSSSGSTETHTYTPSVTLEEALAQSNSGKRVVVKDGSFSVELYKSSGNDFYSLFYVDSYTEVNDSVSFVMPSIAQWTWDSTGLKLKSFVYTLPRWAWYDVPPFATKPKRVSVTLTVSGWDSSAKTQTVTVSGVSADESAQVIQPIPAIASQSAYNAAGILATGQAANKVTFTATTVPTADLSVYIVITEVTA